MAILFIILTEKCILANYSHLKTIGSKASVPIKVMPVTYSCLQMMHHKQHAAVGSSMSFSSYQSIHYAVFSPTRPTQSTTENSRVHDGSQNQTNIFVIIYEKKLSVRGQRLHAPLYK